MKQHGLPPLVGGIGDGQVTWQRIESIDYDTLGYLLSCHLIIEHYLDHFLASHPGAEFGWEAAKLTFGQKIALVSGLSFPEPYNLPPPIKHLNSLRNRFGHNINTSLTEEDLLPLKQFIKKCSKSTDPESKVPSSPKEILHLFTMIVCAYFASAISQHARQTQKGTK